MFRKISVPMVFGASLAMTTLLLFNVSLGLADDLAKIVTVRDECEMVSFNAMFGSGVCQREGKVTVDDFLAYVNQHHDDPLWLFSPESFDLPVGKHLVLENVGGEFHTWTEVEEFGGGIISILNFGEPIRPECGVLPSGASVGTLAAPGPKNIYLEFGDTEDGPTAGSANLSEGDHKFQCCIHPWMQSIVHVHH